MSTLVCIPMKMTTTNKKEVGDELPANHQQ